MNFHTARLQERDVRLSPAPPALRDGGNRPLPVENMASKQSKGRRVQLPQLALRLIAPIGILVIWQLAASLELVDARSLTSPAAVIDAAGSLWSAGDLQRHLLASLYRVVWGTVLGVVGGVTLATAAGLFRWGEYTIDSAMNIVRMVPVIALLPLIILWMGIGEPAKIALIVLGVTFPIYMNSFAAIRGVDQKLVEAGQAFGLSRWGLVRRVILPGAVPGFLVGLRWALGAAWLLLFFAEQINADRGIGYLINQAQSWNRADIIILGLVIYGTFGFVGDQLVRLVEHFALTWRKGFQGA